MRYGRNLNLSTYRDFVHRIKIKSIFVKHPSLFKHNFGLMDRKLALAIGMTPMIQINGFPFKDG